MPELPTPGQRLARGTARHLTGHGFACLTEFVPVPGLRVDLIALGAKGEIWVVECKSGLADFRADAKWQGYLAWCDRFFWAVGSEFPVDILPAGTGLIRADDYDAAIISHGTENRLAPARRAALTRRVAQQAALRLARLSDPMLAGLQAG